MAVKPKLVATSSTNKKVFTTKATHIYRKFTSPEIVRMRIKSQNVYYLIFCSYYINEGVADKLLIPLYR